MKELIGKSFNRYRITELLGEGGMGAVFKAHDVTLQRDVAIKVMHAHLSRLPDFQERFLREARTAARLDHPSIVAVHDFGQAQGMLYIVMEYIPGDNLRTMLKLLRDEAHWLQLDEALGLMTQICTAIDYAHRSGVLHRDIKPSNIMLKPEPANGLPYRPVMTDLGLAKLMESQPITQEGASVGTPPYMSPEQAQGKETDARSDVYSLGILLYELCVNQLPFPIKSLTDAIRYHTTEPPPPPRSIFPDLPQEVEDVILKAIHKAPNDRYADAGALAAAIGSTLEGGTENAPVPSAPAGAISLVTQIQGERDAGPGASQLKKVGPPGVGDKNLIQVIGPDQPARNVVVSGGSLTIGREETNDLVLADLNVSRQHARVEVAGDVFRIIDLNSANSTYLGDNRLLPNVPEIWPPERAVRLGNHLLKLVPRTIQSSTEGKESSSEVSPSEVYTSSGEGWVAAHISGVLFAVEPGQQVEAEIQAFNQGPLVDHFTVRVQGVVADWVTINPSRLQLLPGVQGQFNLIFHPPRTPQSRAGRYPLTLLITSQNDPEQEAVVKAVLTVGEYTQFQAHLHPELIRSGQAARVTIENQGNAQTTFSLNWRDREDALQFAPPQAEVVIAEGQSSTAEFHARPRKRQIIGGAQRYPFEAKVVDGQQNSRSLPGELATRGLLPVWSIPLLTILCLLLAAGGYWFNNASNLQIARQTQTAVPLFTAEAFTLDPDQDGLTTAEEVSYGTRPDDPDTDDDGLLDGEEIRQGTNPLVADTDGDTLLDGREVKEIGTSPVDQDTDGDDLKDNVDPEPLNPSTPLPEPTLLSTLTSTPPPTGTPPPTATPDITSQLLAYYPFDGTLKDASGPPEYDGSRYERSGCFSYIPDRERIFDGAAGIYVCPGNSPSADRAFGLVTAPHIQFSNSFSFGVWIWRQTGGGNDAWIVGQPGWVGLFIDRGFDHVAFRMPYNDLENQIYVTDPNPLESETWAYFVASVRFDGDNTHVTLYRDGERVAESDPAPGPYENPSPTEQLYIGSLLTGLNAYNAYKGGLDDLTVYGRALSADEVRYLFENGGRPIPTTP